MPSEQLSHLLRVCDAVAAIREKVGEVVFRAREVVLGSYDEIIRTDWMAPLGVWRQRLFSQTP
jgi:predicted CoA-binding protein